MLGSMSGTSPGTTLDDGSVLPLNLDAYMLATLTTPHTFGPSFTTLDTLGRATMPFTFPAVVLEVLAGTELSHAFVVFDPADGLATASNPVPLLLED